MMLNALIATWLQNVAWIIFVGVEAVLDAVFKILEPMILHSTGTTTTRQKTKKTVVIVGGNFAGIKVLNELKLHSDLFNVVLIDQRDYFEYTPGILRLFCEPALFRNLAQPLPRDTRHSVIQGKVTSISDSEKKLSYTDPSSPQFPKHISYDYVVLATGSTYTFPISPSDKQFSWIERQQGWIDAHAQLQKASRVLILGAGAVGVELAAEIVDYFPSKKVTIVDASSTLVPLFPKQSSDYARTWFTNRAVDLRLGQRLKRWDETSCTMEDGTIVEADLVYVCFGQRANSTMVSALVSEKSATLPLLDQRKYVRVNSFLRVKDTNIFSCGDIASPPFGGEKQALQAEIQGLVAAQNIVRAEMGKALVKYPVDVAHSEVMPLVFVLSLGRYDGIIGFNWLCVPGPLAAVIKWVLEYTKVLDMQNKPLGKLVWKIAEATTLFLSRTVLKTQTER